MSIFENKSVKDRREEKQVEVLRYRYLRPGGVGVNVAASGTSMAVPLVLAEPDNLYGVQITPSWSTTVFVTAKTTTQFTANFGTVAPGGATIDFIVFRKER